LESEKHATASQYNKNDKVQRQKIRRIDKNKSLLKIYKKKSLSFSGDKKTRKNKIYVPF
jgi:hypothetical protein